jgi:hypothetical protein
MLLFFEKTTRPTSLSQKQSSTALPWHFRQGNAHRAIELTCNPCSFCLLQEEATASPVTEAITAAVHESGGRALGGKAIFIPLLERCGTETTLQIARVPHPTLPSLRAQLTVPHLRFYLSPARVRRVLRVLRAALPGEAFHDIFCLGHRTL